MSSDHKIMRVAKKWGFGMAPVKPDEAARRQESVANVLRWVVGAPGSDADRLRLSEDFSRVKGVLNRAHREDQWDWCTEWLRLGSPSSIKLRDSAAAIGDARRSLIDGVEAELTSLEKLRRLPIERYLRHYLSPSLTPADGTGYIYVLSTREQPTLLKIGHTTRELRTRLVEINSATGIAVPFGVRSAWLVREPLVVEREVHAKPGEYRVRSDREFFQLDFYLARRSITAFVAEHRFWT